MGSASRIKPKKLGEKLLMIRKSFDYSFSQMAERLSDDEVKVLRTDVSRYEKGLREPSLVILLRYARLANASLEMFVDDAISGEDFTKQAFARKPLAKIIENPRQDADNDNFIFINLEEPIIRSIKAKSPETYQLGFEVLVQRLISSLLTDKKSLAKLGHFLRKVKNEFPALLSEDNQAGIEIPLSQSELSDLREKARKARMNPRDFTANLLIAWWLGKLNEFKDNLAKTDTKEKDAH